MFDAFSASRAQEAIRNVRAMKALTLEDPFPDLPRAAVARLAIPALLLYGELSSAFHTRVIEELTRVLPLTNRVVIGVAGHGSPVENPNGFNDAVFDFLTVQAKSGPRANLQLSPARCRNERIRNVPLHTHRASAAGFCEFSGTLKSVVSPRDLC